MKENRLGDRGQYGFRDLIEIMKILRSKDGCPWDREQTHESLKQYLLEETYEVLEAIDIGDYKKIAEELGDVLLQVVFHSKIAEENQQFDIDDVITRICQKMIDRHTHIFGDAKAKDAKEVRQNWEDIKKKEKGLENQTQVLMDVPITLPALMRAYKVQKKAAGVGFDWDSIEGPMTKIQEEFEELKKAYKDNNSKDVEEELGDLLFSVVNLSRFLDVQPELALKATTEKFIKRFRYVEDNAPSALDQTPLHEMDRLWEESKTAKHEDSNV